MYYLGAWVAVFVAQARSKSAIDVGNRACGHVAGIHAYSTSTEVQDHMIVRSQLAHPSATICHVLVKGGATNIAAALSYYSVVLLLTSSVCIVAWYVAG